MILAWKDVWQIAHQLPHNRRLAWGQTTDCDLPTESGGPWGYSNPWLTNLRVSAVTMSGKSPHG